MRWLALAGLLLLAACGDEGLEAERVELPDGRTVACVHDDGQRVRALDCDWERAR